MGTVTKALSLLSLFTRDRATIGLSEMARLSGQNKATVYRLLGELQSAGFVEQLEDQRGYRLGSEVLRLAALREAAVPMIGLGQRVLDTLSAQTGETAHMSLVRGDQLVTLAHASSSRHATRVIMDPAEQLSFHGTSSGLAILAFSTPAFVDRILTQPLPAHTESTLTDPALIRARLAEVRQAGFSQYLGGYERDVHSHAAAFFDAAGHAIGAISVAAPRTRVNAEISAKTARLVCDAARNFTLQTGGDLPACPTPYFEEAL